MSRSDSPLPAPVGWPPSTGNGGEAAGHRGRRRRAEVALVERVDVARGERLELEHRDVLARADVVRAVQAEGAVRVRDLVVRQAAVLRRRRLVRRVHGVGDPAGCANVAVLAAACVCVLEPCGVWRPAAAGERCRGRRPRSRDRRSRPEAGSPPYARARASRRRAAPGRGRRRTPARPGTAEPRKSMSIPFAGDGHREPVGAQQRTDGGDARRRRAEARGELSGREVVVEERRVLVGDRGDEAGQRAFVARAGGRRRLRSTHRRALRRARALREAGAAPQRRRASFPRRPRRHRLRRAWSTRRREARRRRPCARRGSAPDPPSTRAAVYGQNARSVRRVVSVDEAAAELAHDCVLLDAGRRDGDLAANRPVRARDDGRLHAPQRRQVRHEANRAADGGAALPRAPATRRSRAEP